MGFKKVKSAFLTALENNSLTHETRTSIGEKNWIASGRLSTEEARAIVALTTGNQANSSQHHFDPNIDVWVFKPTHQGQRWYVKGYLDGDELRLVELRLISFHPSEERAE